MIYKDLSFVVPQRKRAKAWLTGVLRCLQIQISLSFSQGRQCSLKGHSLQGSFLGGLPFTLSQAFLCPKVCFECVTLDLNTQIPQKGKKTASPDSSKANSTRLATSCHNLCPVNQWRIAHLSVKVSLSINGTRSFFFFHIWNTSRYSVREAVRFSLYRDLIL